MYLSKTQKYHYEFLNQRRGYGRPEIDLKTRTRETPRNQARHQACPLSAWNKCRLQRRSTQLADFFRLRRRRSGCSHGALLETVGEQSTIVMPTYSTNKKLLEVTQAEREAGVLYKEQQLPYDPEETPCWTGIIPDTFWRRKQAIRSSQPRCSLAAIGPKVDELSRGWAELLEADGHMLIIGVSLANCSAMHLAEKNVSHLAQYISEAPQPPRTLKEFMEKHKAEGLADVGVMYPGKLSYPHFERMEEPCRKHRIVKIVRVEEATLKLFRLRDLVNLYAEYLRRDPDGFYHD